MVIPVLSGPRSVIELVLVCSPHMGLYLLAYWFSSVSICGILPNFWRLRNKDKSNSVPVCLEARPCV